MQQKTVAKNRTKQVRKVTVNQTTKTAAPQPKPNQAAAKPSQEETKQVKKASAKSLRAFHKARDQYYRELEQVKKNNAKMLNAEDDDYELALEVNPVTGEYRLKD